jgi:2-phospho-L-lactate guanylyltransferase (CobY/MobA/RfbA family)
MRSDAMMRFIFRHGPDSYALRLQQARKNGLTTSRVNDCRLAFDVDEPAQYAAWRSRTAVPS